MSLRQSFQQRFARETRFLLDEHMRPDRAEASLVRIEFDSHQLITALVIEADTDIRMGIVAGNRD